MKATHNIKVNGVWYRVGEEIAEVSSPIIEVTTPIEEVEVDNLFEEEKVEEPKKTTKRTKK